MANDYFNNATDLIPLTRARSGDVEANLSLVAQGFDKLPTPLALANNALGYVVDTGEVNAFVVPAPSTQTTLADGLGITFKAKLANTGPATLAVGAFGAKQLVRADGSPLVANDIFAGQMVVVRYNATTERFQYTQNAIASATAADASATAAAESESNAAASAAAAAASATAAAAAAAFSDSNPVVKGSLDETKQLRFEVDGLTTGTTRTITVPDENFTLAGRGANTFTGAQNEARAGDIPSAATVNLDAATGNLVHVTGTTAITGFILAAGAERDVVFDGVLTLTHSVSLLLPSAASITTAAGDRATFRGDSGGAVRCMHYTRANGMAVVASQAGVTLLATASAASVAAVDFTQFIDGTYEQYIFELINVVPSIANAKLYLRTSSDAGATFDAASGNYYESFFTAAFSATGAETAIRLGGAGSLSSTGSDGGITSHVTLFDPSSTTKQKHFHIQSAVSESANLVQQYIGAAMRRSVVAVNAVRFLFSSGDIASGKFKLYGINKAV